MNTYTKERGTESALIKKLIQGDADAIQILVTQYTDDVYRFVFKPVGSENTILTSRILVWLGLRSYGIYLLHIYIVVGLQIPLIEIALGPLTKFLIVTVMGFILTFLVVDTLRRMPAVRKII